MGTVRLQWPDTVDADARARASAREPFTLLGAAAPVMDSGASASIGSPRSGLRDDGVSLERESNASGEEAMRRQALTALRIRLRCNGEQCRLLRARLMAQPGAQHQVYTVASSMEAEGRTTTCLGLAMSFAELPTRRVLVIEADPLAPQMEPMLSLPPGHGFTDWLAGRCSREAASTQVAHGSFSVMRAGDGDENRLAEHLVSPSIVQKFEELRRRFDHIIIDTPPVSRSAEAGLIGKLSDDVLLLIRTGHTPRHAIDRTMRVLDGFGARPSAAILTGGSN